MESPKEFLTRGNSRKIRKLQMKMTAMRAKHFILILCCVVITTIIFIAVGPAGEPNDSLKSIVKQTHQTFNEFQQNLRDVEKKKLEIDPKYLAILGFTTYMPTKDFQNFKYYNTIDSNTIKNAQSPHSQQTHSSTNNNNNAIDGINSQHLLLYPAQNTNKPSSSQHHQLPRVTSTPYNGTKSNFSIVTYVQNGQVPSAILLSQNIATKFPNEYLLIYDLGLSEADSRTLGAHCNSSRCSVIGYDLSEFPRHVTDQRTHAYRPIVIKDALMRSKCILFTENTVRIRGTSRDLHDLQNKVSVSGVLGWNTATAVSTLTHPKMFDYFQTDADDFFFLRMVELDVALFADSLFVIEKIMLPWIKCALTADCIDPIGAQSIGCNYNKKPLYRYSGCHAYDTSAFNIVLGLTWHLDDSKYSLPSETYSNIFYKETLDQSTKILENRKRNSSETSEHPEFTED